METNDSIKWVTLTLGFVFIIALLQNKKRRQEEVETSIQRLTANLATGNIQGTVGGTISNTQRDSQYLPAQDAEEIYYAGCNSWLMCADGGNEQKVAAIISRLNKAQLATLSDHFKTTYKTTLDQYIAQKFWASERAVIQQAIANVRN